MFPLDIWLAYTLASVLIVLAPGPDIVLSIARGLSQGARAATLSSIGAATGILLHSAAAAFGLAVLIQASATAFLIVKILGAAYVVYLGIRTLIYRDLITLLPTRHRPGHAIYVSGLMTNVLNPKIGLFVLAFVPQFVDATRGPVSLQMMVYGAWLALIAGIGLSIVGGSASALSTWLGRHPRVIAGINISAGTAFVLAGVSAAVVRH